MPASLDKAFNHPADTECPIWRYMDFTKFVSMLENGGLFFSRADYLGDPFEGSYPRENLRIRSEVGMSSNASGRSHLARWTRQWIMISCWHMNRYESAAMWNLYAKSNEAIAIKSTFAKLFEVLDSNCYVGVVNYIDYDTEWIQDEFTFYPYLHKRKSFSHENEVRAVIATSPGNRGKVDYEAKQTVSGILKPVNLSHLIDEVLIAPTAADWFSELVSQVVSRYSLCTVVSQSKLDEQPFF